MARRRMTTDEVRNLLAQRCEGQQRQAWAKAHNISATYLSSVIKGRAQPGQLILDALGLERVVLYERK